jgi:hypothetical protein
MEIRNYRKQKQWMASEPKLNFKRNANAVFLALKITLEGRKHWPTEPICTT